MDPYSQYNQAQSTASHVRKSIIIVVVTFLVIGLAAYGFAVLSDTTEIASDNTRCTDADVDMLSPDIDFRRIDKLCLTNNAEVDSFNILNAYAAGNFAAIHSVSINAADRINLQDRLTEFEYNELNVFDNFNPGLDITNRRIINAINYRTTGIDSSEEIYNGAAIYTESDYADSYLYEYQYQFDIDNSDAPQGTYPLYIRMTYLAFENGDRFFVSAKASSYEIPRL